MIRFSMESYIDMAEAPSPSPSPPFEGERLRQTLIFLFRVFIFYLIIAAPQTLWSTSIFNLD